MGTPYMLVSFAGWGGVIIGQFWPWTGPSAMQQGLIRQYIPEYLDAIIWRIPIACTLFVIIMFAILYVVFRGWKMQNYGEATLSATPEKPEPFNKQQKITLIIIVVIILVVLIPSILKVVSPNPVIDWITTNISITVLCAVGVSLMCILKLGDFDDVMSHYVNWKLLCTITGIGMYCSMGNILGLKESLTDILQHLNPAFAAPAILAIGGILSFMTAADVVLPLLYSLVPVLAATSGISPVTLSVAMAMGTAVSCYSPFSVGGAGALVGAPQEVSEKAYPRQIIMAVLFIIVMAIGAYIGIFGK